MDVRAKLKELELDLPPVPAAVADYVPAVRSGNLVFVSGQLPMRDGQLMARGRVPDVVSLDVAQACAGQCILNGLAAVGDVLDGDWSKLIRIVRLGVFVNCGPDYDLQHKVANGASELLGKIFGEQGRHARAAVGAPGLPLGAPVEVELTVEVR